MSFQPYRAFPQPTVEGDRKPHYFPSLDGVRGFAALWVVLYHAHTAGHVSQLTGAMPVPVRVILFDWGYLGVPIFFTLSGFVIAHSLFQRTFSWAGFKTFMVRRFLRLAPAYWASIALILLLNITSSRIRAEALELPSLVSLIAHLGFVQDLLHHPALSPIYWTLGVEMQFYALFYGLLWLNQGFTSGPDVAQADPWHRSHWRFLAMAGSLALVGLANTPQWLSWGKFCLPYWYCFLFGILTHWSIHRRIHSGWLWAMLAACGLLVGPWPSQTMGEPMAYYLASIALTLAIVGLAQRGWLGLGKGLILSKMGTLSYSLYLIHGAVFSPFFFVRQRLGASGLALEGASLVGAIALSYLVAELFYRWIEQPSCDWSKSLRPPNQPAESL